MEVTEKGTGAYERMFARLNKAQKMAVEQIDGPLLVVAGPGTGKTQLLSARVAHILRVTDTLPQNILCLTFTENGAANMRERLTRFIGQEAYNVTIGTYHAFGGDLIQRFPEYFSETRLQSPVDDLGRRQIVSEIVDAMSFTNPLKSTQYHLGDLISTLSEVKRALLSEADLRAIASENATFVTSASKDVHKIFDGLTSMPRTIGKALPYYEQLLRALRTLAPTKPTNTRFGSLAHIAAAELEQAIATATEASSTKPLTAWKNTWIAKNADNHYVFAGELQNKRIEALADVFRQYQAALTHRGLYDFDDMILRAITALERNKDLRYSLQEQYLYILLDEFQDTNAAQLRLVQLLTENPVNEGRPNVMAVGDDDQAIYAFQGAQYSNMLDFWGMYRDVSVVNLIENYRSHPHILHVAHAIAGQINARLDRHFDGMSKILKAANKELPPQAHIDRHEFLSDVGQYDWIAEQISNLVKKGTSPSEIAVLAPRHRQLEPLVPFLNDLGIPVRYEKRENILEAPIVRQLIHMSKLILALEQHNETTANALWPEVLSYDFWQIPVADIWRLSWKVSDSRGELGWSEAALNEKVFQLPVMLMLTLAHRAGTETLEVMLDLLIGTLEAETHDKLLPRARSPLRAYYTSANMRKTQPEIFYQTLSHLTVLRSKLRDHQATREHALTLQDFIDFVGLYEAAEERMINTSPYNQHAEAVQLMTVFKAKGLEFEHVFLPSCQDDVWGESSRGNHNKLTLPANLAPIRHAGASEDERLRIFFVAITRAKLGLHLTSFIQSFSGKSTKRLKYLHEQEQQDGIFKSLILPTLMQTVQRIDSEVPQQETFESNWRSRHSAALAHTQLHDLLIERLRRYQLSPTHLNTFTDMVYGGPEAFFYRTLLGFPEAPTIGSQYGNAIHETLQWVQQQVDKQDGTLPAAKDTLHYFDAIMKRKKLSGTQTTILIERGERALKAFLKQRSHIFHVNDKAECNFRGEGVLVGDVHMSGKIDRMEIDRKNKTIVVVDYKTGVKSFNRWTSDIKLHNYRRQLYCYKLLIEGSHSFQGYRVEMGRIEFVDPDDNGHINSLELPFNDKNLEETKQLLNAMWQHVKKLKLPDTSNYDISLTGTRQFEADLISGDV